MELMVPGGWQHPKSLGHPLQHPWGFSKQERRWPGVPMDPPPVPRTGAQCQQTPARTPLLFTLLLRVRVRVHQALFAARVLIFILAPILFLAAALVLLLLLLLRAECLTSARSGALPFPPCSPPFLQT